MQRIDAQTIGDVLRQTIQECNMTAKLDEQKAIRLWVRMIGEGISDRCGRPTVQSGVMKVPVKTASLRHELTMNRSMMVRLINEHLGKTVINDIHFTS